jgi:ribosomal protein S18 acetylase RimI-like enzyme
MPPSSVLLRSFRLADYDQVHAIWKGSRGVGLSESDSREAIGRFLRRNPGLSQVAVLNGRVIAAMLCGHDGRRGCLHHLAVAHEWRRNGLGRALVATCLGKLRKAGIDKCNLFLFSANRPAKTFWRRLGWKVRGDLRIVQRLTASELCANR